MQAASQPSRSRTQMASTPLQALAGQLAEATKVFDRSAGEEALKSRIEIVSKAKQIATLMLGPEEMVAQHCSSVSTNVGFWLRVLNFMQMAELIAIRSLMKMRVLENIPPEGSISLRDLSRKTGAQDSLLGSFPVCSFLRTCTFG